MEVVAEHGGSMSWSGETHILGWDTNMLKIRNAALYLEHSTCPAL